MDFLKTALDKIRAKGAGPLLRRIEPPLTRGRDVWYFDGNPEPAGIPSRDAFETDHEADLWREGYEAGRQIPRAIAAAARPAPRDAAGSPIVAAEKVRTPIEISTIEDLGVRRFISPDTDLDPDLGCEPFPGSCGVSGAPRSFDDICKQATIDDLRAENAELRDEINRAREDGIALGRKQGHAAAVEMELAPGISPAQVERLALLVEAAGSVAEAAGQNLLHGWRDPEDQDLDQAIDSLHAAAAIMRQEGDLPSVDIARRAELVAYFRDNLDLPALDDAEVAA